VCVHVRNDAPFSHIFILFFVERCIERRGLIINTPVSYSGSSGFKSRPGDWLS
jgi:hypothetical protein